MQVFYDQRRWCDGSQRLDERNRDVERLGTVRDERFRLAPELGRRLEQRPQRPWSEQWVARSPQHRDASRELVTELAQQCRLADPGLPGHEDYMAVAARGDLGQTSVQQA
jgi:hypothetical protein